MRLSTKRLTIGKLKISWVYMVGLFVLLFAIYLRFANFPLKYGFDIDPTRDSLITSYGASHLQFPLIGPRSGIGPFTFGPWYYYELIFFKLLVPLAYSPWILIGLMSLGFVVVMYFIGKALEGKWFGIILAAIAALSPEQIGPTTGLSNPNLVPIHAGLTVLFFILYLKKKTLTPFLVILWGFLFGVGINHHYQVVLLFPLLIFAFLYKINKRALLDALLFLLGVIISFLPLLIYNLGHHFTTVTGVIFYLTKGRQIHYIPNSWSIYTKEFWVGKFLSMTFGITSFWIIVLLFGSFFGFVWAVLKKALSPIYILLLLTFFIDFIFLRYFIVQRELYYFLFLHPFLFLFVGFVLWQLRRITFGWLVITFLILATLPSVLYQDSLRVGSRADQISSRIEASKIEKAFPKDTFAIYGCGKSNLNRPQGVVFFLSNDNRLSGTGKVIVLMDTNCTEDLLHKNHIDFVNINNNQTVEVKNEDRQTLEKLSWKLISPKTVYQDYLENN